MRVLAIAAVALASLVPAPAGMWEPNPNVRYRLDVSDAVVAAPTETEERWVQSLVDGLARTEGSDLTGVYRFGRCSSNLAINGETSSMLVYTDRDRPSRFLIVREEDERSLPLFVVDFIEKTVGVASGSLHVPPSKRFAVIVEPPRFGQIPVLGAPDTPAFQGNIATWY